MTKQGQKNRDVLELFKIKKDRALTTFFLENRRKEGFCFAMGRILFFPNRKRLQTKKTPTGREGTAENQAGGGTAHKINCLWISSYGEKRMTEQGQNKKGQGVDYFLFGE